MPKKDPRVDAYIANSAEFARPILNHVRRLVHAACPDVEETIKWSAPHFVHEGILVAMPAFKQHCALIFWQGKLIFGKAQRAKLRRLTSISDLPDDKVLAGYIMKAVVLNERGVKSPVRAKPKRKAGIIVPDYFLAALKKNKRALTAFEGFSPSRKWEYVEWITEAKREETRVKRIGTAVAWMAEGKPRNWKYI